MNAVQPSNSSLSSGPWVLLVQLGPGLPDRLPNVVKVGNNNSAPLNLNTGAPQGCMLSPLLYTHDCVATHVSNSIIKFAEGKTVVGLISNTDETAFRVEDESPGKAVSGK